MTVERIKFIKMARLWIILLLVLFVQLSHTHPLTVFRITRELDNEPESATVIEGDAILVSSELNGERSKEGSIGDLIQIPRSLVEQPETVLIDVAYPGGDEDLVLAETHVFRPLFTYRQKISKRLKLKKKLQDDQK